MLRCPKCKEEFERVGCFVAHYRHVHTDYLDRLARIRRELRGSKISKLQMTIMVKDQARNEIEEEINKAIIDSGAKI